MTRQETKKILTIDRSMIGLIILLFGMGVSWATLQSAMRANATEIASVTLDYKAADSRFQSGNQTRFMRIEALDRSLVQDMTSQEVLLERIVTTMEFIQRDVGKLVEQSRD